MNDRQIRQAIANGDIVLDPPASDSDIQPASVDVYLGSRFHSFKKRIMAVDLRHPPRDLMEEWPASQHHVLRHGEMCLCSLAQRLSLPSGDIVARVEGKSTLARHGLMVHITAGFVDPGWDGYLTLEVVNQAPHGLQMHAGMKIAQLSFERLDSRAERLYGDPGLNSHYADSTEPTPVPPRQ